MSDNDQDYDDKLRKENKARSEETRRRLQQVLEELRFCLEYTPELFWSFFLFIVILLAIPFYFLSLSFFGVH